MFEKNVRVYIVHVSVGVHVWSPIYMYNIHAAAPKPCHLFKNRVNNSENQPLHLNFIAKSKNILTTLHKTLLRKKKF